jgi:hypothetical protein
MNLGLVAITAIVFFVMVTKTKMKEDSQFAAKKMRKTARRYHVYYDNPLTRKSFRHIANMLGSLQYYDELGTKVETVKQFERALIIAFIMPVAGMILMQDTFLAMVLIVFSMIYFNSTIYVKYDKMYVQLMEECSLTIASMREKFMEYDNIPSAVLYAEHSMVLDAPLKTIYKMLTAVNAEEVKDSFGATYPVPIVKTLGNLCYILNDEGVEKRPDGSDSFTESLTILRQECDAEVRRLTKQRIAFNSLKMLTLVGLGVTPIAELYLLKMIPGTASLLKGYYGFFLHVGVVLVTIYAFNYVSNACRPSVVATSDRMEFIDELRMTIPKLREFSRKLRPKDVKTQVKYKDLFDGSLSSQDLDYIYTAKIVFAVVCSILTLIALIFGTITVRGNFKHNYNSLSFIPSSLKESQQIQLRYVDDELIVLPREEFQVYEDDKEELKAFIKGRVSGIADSEASTQADRIITKYNVYHNATYHWWWWLVMYAGGIVGWFIPNFLLNSRKNMVKYEASVDVSQLQTVMIVLSETKMEVYRVLVWLQEQATVHNAILRLCRCRFIMNPENALDQMEEGSPENDFKRMIRQMKSAVYNLSLRDAFSGLKLDKQQSMAISEMLRTEEIEQRKNSAKLIAIAPAGIALIGSFVGPVLILGITQMTDTLAALGSM